jgi:tetratricopeptide (TPR) repeat protein
MKLDCGFMANATENKSIAASSRRNVGRPVNKKSREAITKKAGTASTCPHTTLSAITAGLNSTAATTTVNITAVDSALVLGNAGNTIGYTELQAVPPAIDAALTVSDADSLTLASAAVGITNGFLAGDTLNFSNQNGISGSYNAATGLLTLNGIATVAQYQAALDDYNKVIENYPKSFKTASARMRKGYCLAELGQKAAAIRELRAVVRLYPGTDEAKRSAAKLRELGATAG